MPFLTSSCNEAFPTDGHNGQVFLYVLYYQSRIRTWWRHLDEINFAHMSNDLDQ